MPQEDPDQVKQATSQLWDILYQLNLWSRDSDLRVSRNAFNALAAVLDELLAWFWIDALFHEAALGKLSRTIQTDEAWERYSCGEHVGAWAGAELARLYKRFKAELGSRSKHSINRLRDLRFGLDLGSFDFPPNQWFCAEYERRTDYRPTGEMAVWVARKIEEVRLLKKLRTVAQPQNNTETVLPAWCQSAAMVKGLAALQQLDEMPQFGSSDPGAFEAWRKLIRRQLLTQSDIVTEFQSLFPHDRRKLDGVLTTTLRCAWRAVHHGGQIFFPALSGPCK